MVTFKNYSPLLKITKYILLLFTILSFGFNSIAQKIENLDPLKILFIGNSYTHMNNMPKLFDKIATSNGENVEVVMSAKSSHTFEMHSQRSEMYAKINSEQWDYVVLQGFSRELSYSKQYIDSVSLPYIQQIVDSIHQNNSCTDVMLFMTWGYENGFKNRDEINTFSKMAKAVQYGYRYIADTLNLMIAPVGDVWKEVRSNPAIQLYEKDQMHPSVMGSHLIVTTLYTSIFKKKSMYQSAFNGGNTEKMQFIDDMAYNYILSNPVPHHLNNNQLTLSAETRNRKEFYLLANALYPGSSAVLWDFGDGTRSREVDITHRYKKKGTYTIRLEIIDGCGIRNSKHTVTFVKPNNIFRRRKKSKEMRD